MSEVTSYSEALARFERERSDPQWHPVHLGFGTIDAELRGISMGQVLLIAARSGVGKTFLLESIEHNFAARTDAGQLSLSLEMPGGEGGGEGGLQDLLPGGHHRGAIHPDPPGRGTPLPPPPRPPPCPAECSRTL